MTRRTMLSIAALVVAAAAAASAAGQARPKVSANSLKADVSFLAAAALQGRATPSPGLEVAAEYIASQFRGIGLEPIGDDGYFQTARYESVTPVTEGAAITLDVDGRTVAVGKGLFGFQDASALDVKAMPAVFVAKDGALDQVPADQVRGKALIIEYPEDASRMMAFGRQLQGVTAAHQPALLLLLRPGGAMPPARARMRERASATATGAARTAMITVTDRAVTEAMRGAKTVSVSAHVPAPTTQPVVLRNVIGLLRGTDPALAKTYLVLSAHYDHMPPRGSGEGDHIMNGANDDASGVATVIETARALAALPQKPKRSIVFLAMFGEEIGGLGSGYYCQHPLVPLADTLADVNLEQIGRTDSSEGSQLKQFNLTGFDFTTLAPAFAAAGKETGVRVVKHDKFSDAYFGASDNASFSQVGVPSTTISVTYQFPDYHAVGDEWQKIDYENMAAVVDTIALGMLRLATDAPAPQWNKDNPKVAEYVKAREKK